MKKPITVISSISILLFLIAILWFGAGIYIDKKNGSQKADSRYEKLLSDTKENFSINSYGTSEFSNNFIRAIGNIDDFSSLKLEINGTLVYSYPPQIFSLPSPEPVKSYTDTIYFSDNNFTLKASIYLMTPSSVYKHSRLAFLLILLGTVLVGVFIVLHGNSSNFNFSYSSQSRKKYNNKKFSGLSDSEEIDSFSDSADSKSNTPSEEKSESENSQINEIKEAETESKAIFNPENVIETQKESGTKDSIEIPSETPIFTDEDEQEWNNEELFENEEKETSDEIDLIDKMEQENQQISNETLFNENLDKKDSNQEIFEHNKENKEQISPITQLNLQASLERKLDEAIVSETQVSISLIKINGLDRGNSISQKVVLILKNSLKEAQLFEYQADSYAVITVGSDLQSTVDDFENIYNRITDFLKDNNAANEVSIGISSVSGRSVDANRIILEASQALNFASRDPDSPIVAFRANPDKYREMQEE